MPRPKFVVSNDYLLSLKKLVEVNYGTSISNTSDCIKISNLIAGDGYGTISPQTLRRLFGFIKTEFNPSPYTLNVLCRYCGFEDWSHFVKKNLNSDLLLQDIINVCTAFFSIEVPPVQTNRRLEHPYFFAAQNIAKLINNNLDLYSRVIPKLAKNKAAHEYFFHRFILIDKLCSGYAIGYKSYLKHVKSAEGVIFGNAILFMGAILEEDLVTSGKYLAAINGIKTLLTASIHPYVVARAIGSNLLYYHSIEDMHKKQETLAMIDAVLINNPNRFGFDKDSCEFEFMICEYLLLAECYEKIKNIMPQIFQTYSNQSLAENMAKWHFVPSHLIYYKALVMTNEFVEAKKVPHTTGKEQDGLVYWCSKNYYAIHLLQCKLKMTTDKRTKANLEKEYNYLISQTHFTYFNRLLQ